MNPIEILTQGIPTLLAGGPKQYKKLIREALLAERRQKLETIIEFQIFMHEKGYISDFLWDFEKMANQFLKHKKEAQRQQ